MQIIDFFIRQNKTLNVFMMLIYPSSWWHVLGVNDEVKAISIPDLKEKLLFYIFLMAKT